MTIPRFNGRSIFNDGYMGDIWIPSPSPSPPTWLIDSDTTYTRVPTTPFPFALLSEDVRLIILEFYLSSVDKRYSPGQCVCTQVSEHGFKQRALSPSDTCFSLHARYGWHPKFLPLLMTSRQMYLDFRSRLYGSGTYTIVPPNAIRERCMRDNWTWTLDPNEQSALVAVESKTPNAPTTVIVNPLLSYITADPLSVCNKRLNADKKVAQCMPLAQLGLGTWDDVRRVEMSMEFEFYKDARAARAQMELLVHMLKKRERPLFYLCVKMCWYRAREWGPAAVGTVWRETIVEPLGRVEWGREGAVEVLFEIGDWWDGKEIGGVAPRNGGKQRSLLCRSFEELERGLEVGVKEGRAVIEPWPGGRA
ncbi:hypothetical protein EJ04DRAFT_513734 [Polyplosphaeria fusca]|uniref:Uncharacterized protein n=1 Tax=Polyplosphaeria fusca TaxID=682080 RepID=A0A9P4QUG8_9PLEO|nr:hypothetical protein EJ04DRAFT_513734 [Polyplosphaeria fusca]